MKLLFIILIFAFVSCGTTGSYIPLNSTYNSRPDNCELTGYMPGQVVKEETEIIGYYSVQETGFSVICSWDEVKEKIRLKACQVGSDIIQFTQIDTPSISSTCYRAKANFLKIKK